MILGTTGHRPTRLATRRGDMHLIDRFAALVIREKKPDKVVTGMALGWDTAVAKACAAQRIPFIAAVPFKGQEETWQKPDRESYQVLLAAAEETVYVSEPGYDLKKLFIRNQWIVDNCTEMLALWDGCDDGGTAHAVRAANKASRPLVNVWLDWRTYYVKERGQ